MLTSTVAINNGNASSYGVGFYGNSDPATQFAPTVYPQEADLPAPPPPPIQQMPVVPKAAAASKPLGMRSFGDLADDPTVGNAVQNMKNHMAGQAESAKDNLDAFSAMVVPGGSAYEVITGETITGKEVPVLQRVMMATFIVLPFAPEGAGKLSQVAGKVNKPSGGAAPVAKAGGKINGHEMFSAVKGNPFRGENAPNEAYKHLAKFHGIPEHVAKNRLHKIKKDAGLGAADDVIIGRTGDVYDAITNRPLGSLTAPSTVGAKR